MKLKSLAYLCILMALAFTAVGCGEKKTEDTPPPPTNSSVNADIPASLVGNYKIKSFDTTVLGAITISSDNYSQIQDLVGQTTISMAKSADGTKDNFTVMTKAQLESSFLDALGSIGDGFKLMVVPPISTEAKATNGVFGTLDPAAASVTIAVVNPTTLKITQVLMVVLNPEAPEVKLPVEVVFIVEKVNDLSLTLDNSPYWSSQAIDTTNTVTSMNTLLSYYKIDNITYPDGTSSNADLNPDDDLIAGYGTTFYGNMTIALAGINPPELAFTFKFQDLQKTGTKFAYKYDVAKFLITDPDAMNKIPQQLELAGATIVDATAKTMKIEFTANRAHVTHALGLTGDEKLTMYLTKLYDTNPKYPKSVVNKQYIPLPTAP